MAFKTAVKHEAKLRLALAGPAGSGKTYTALKLALELADGKPIAVIDTERGSASKYADIFPFDVLELEPPYHPDRYIAAMREAQDAGYAVLVIDSLTHAWQGQGGLLEVHEQVVKRQTTKNSYTAWAEVTPIQNRLIDAITSAGLHVIATMRAKTEYIQDQGANGKTQVRRVGTAPIQRDGMEFEFDVLGELDQDNTLIVQKSRCSALAGAIIEKPGKAMADTLRTWLSGAPALALSIEHDADIAARDEMERERARQEYLKPKPSQAAQTGADPWADTRELAASLKLSDEERAAIFKRHKKQPIPILVELRRRYEQKLQAELATITEPEEPDVTFAPETLDLADIPTGHVRP